MKNLALLAIWPVALLLTGCPLNSTQQQQVLRASDNAALVVAAGQKAETTAFNDGLISQADHSFIEQQFGSVGQVMKAVDSCVAGSGNKGAILSCLSTAINSVDAINANGGLYLKSAQAKNDFAVAVGGVRSVLASIEATLGGTPPVAPTGGGQ